MTAAVTVDVAGGPMGGAARFRDELYLHIARTGREDVQVIGADRQVDVAWLVRREASISARDRRVALNNVGFVAPGGSRWTLLGNALHFLTDDEAPRLDPSIRAANRAQAAVVRMAARRSDVLVAPCTAMAERVTRVMPSLRSRVVVRMHPVSGDSIPSLARDPVILCPAFFTPYRHMVNRLTELLTAIHEHVDPKIHLLITADPEEVPADLAGHPRVELVGRLPNADLRRLWGRSSAIYFPPGLESFGYPLAEARVSGHPVIARDTAQNQEIAGPALCGFDLDDEVSLRCATIRALSTNVAPDPALFDPDAYFNWMLGTPR
jgi:glycosyltransferase involved in cell wall biosynthesis